MPVIPSKACEPCRKKRRKCDYRLPGCSQCRRAKVECPGYRDAFTSRIRDQSELIARKVQGRRGRDTPDTSKQDVPSPRQGLITRPKYSPSDQDAHILSYGPAKAERLERSEEDQDNRLWTAQIPDDITQTGLTYFMQIYANHSFFSYLPDLFSTIAHENRDDLNFIISVPALVLLAHDLQRPNLSRIAYARHAKALAKTHNALSSPSLVKRDSTLLSVLCLGLFESLVLRGPNVSNWDAHMHGSAALLNIRGKSQFDTVLGQRLFVHCSGFLLSRYCASGTPLPQFLKPLQDHAVSIGVIDEIGVKQGLNLTEFATLEAQGPDFPIALRLRKLIELDQRVTDILKALELLFPHEKLNAHDDLPRQICCYKSRYYVFPSFAIAKRWNNFRMTRFYILDRIAKICSHMGPIDTKIDDLPGGNSWSHIHQTAVHSAEAIVEDVLFSVPYHIELSSHPSILTRSLILPLSSILESPLTPLSARLYALERLAFVGTEYGIAQAQDAANLLRNSGKSGGEIVVSHWS
ncbi:hypothetical protein F5Y16DRAFT_47917 [Xylariaceae sp. FL0255]|nr:hypothetical protein F5Y16DRAFT_47917 [Xylariaceae sp. FL0255]